METRSPAKTEAKDGTSATDGALYLVSIPALAIAHAWLLAVMWRWFFVPLGAPVIATANLYGAALLVSSITRSAHTTRMVDGALMYVAREAWWIACTYFVAVVVHAVMRW